MARVKARKDDISGRSRDRLEKLAAATGATARSSAATPLRVAARGRRRRRTRLAADASSSTSAAARRCRRPARPRHGALPDQQLDDGRSTSLPEHLIIVGGSYIGLEFGQMFRRFGSEVTIIEMGAALVGREDEDVSAGDSRDPGRRGHRRPPERQVHQPVASGPGAIAVRRRLHGRARRRSIGIAPAARRRPPAQHRRSRPRRGRHRASTRAATSSSTTSCAPASPGIWALGDCNGQGAFTHTSYNDSEIVAANLLDGDARGVSATASPPTASTSIRRSAASA